MWSGEEIAKGLQNYMICIEMLVAAVAHKYSFTFMDYKDKGAKSSDSEDRMPFINAFIESR